MTRLLVLFGLIMFLLWSNYQSSQHPQLKFNALSDRITHPFDTRLRYRIAEIDPRFKLSPEQVKSISLQATQIWKDGTGQDYFVYDDNAKLSIHLIYDERQFESEQRRAHIRQLEANQKLWLNKKQQLDQIEQKMLHNKQFLQHKQQQLDQQIQHYHQEMRQYNTAQHADYFQQQQRALQHNIQALQQEINQYNQQIVQLNQQIDQLNSLDQQLDNSVQQFKQRFQPHLFHKGLFNGKQIMVYEFASEADLRLTLAHELGHALGLQHANDPHALMYPMLQQQNVNNFRLSAADKALLSAR